MGEGRRPPGPPPRTKRALLDEFDADHDGRLNRTERVAAREAVQKEKSNSKGMGWPPPMPQGKTADLPRGPLSHRLPATAGPRIALSEIVPLPANTSLYAPATLRTLWLEFDDSDWEDELTDFYDSDVELPATLTVDGKKYPGVGVQFRGMSSYMMVPKGLKRSLSLSLNAWNKDQLLLGYRSLNLLNSAHDATYLRAVLALEIERHYLPAPKANHVRVVINGESWGVYVNVQPFNKDFVKEWFGTTEGRRWKVPGSPGAQGSLAYLGEDPKAYRGIYQLKSKDEPAAYRELIRLCRVLDQSAPERLEQDLPQVLDVDRALRYLALDNLLINSDGYFLRTSDYGLYQGTDGRFVVIPHDVNETLNALEAGPGMETKVGVQLDPLYAADEPQKTLIYKLLSVPKWRAQYLGYMREMAEIWLDWTRLGPIAEGYRASIQSTVQTETRGLDSFENFTRGFTENTMHEGPCGKEPSYGLRPFVEARRAYLLSHPAIRGAIRSKSSK